jgi:hypothetical protein
MKVKANAPQSFIKMAAARRLKDQGHYQESLLLALEALSQALDNLRSSLLALQSAVRSELSSPARQAREKPPDSEPCWRPAVNPRVLH